MGTKVSALPVITDPVGGKIYIVDSGTASKGITVANLLAETGTFAGDSVGSDTGSVTITSDVNGYINHEAGTALVYGYVSIGTGTSFTGIYIKLPFTVGGTSGSVFMGTCALDHAATLTVGNAGGLVCVAIEGATSAYIYRQDTDGIDKIGSSDMGLGNANLSFSLTYEVA